MSDAAPVPTNDKPVDPPANEHDSPLVVEEISNVEGTFAESKADVVPVAETLATAEVTSETQATILDPTLEEVKPVVESEGISKEERPKSPGFIAKIFAPLKKAKVPRSPKKEKKKDDTEVPTLMDDGSRDPGVVTVDPESGPTKTEEVSKAIGTSEPVISEPASLPIEEKDDVKEKKEEKSKAAKINRRLSARLGDIFKSKPKQEVSTPAKVDEHPPKIDEPPAVAPLEDPVTERVNEATIAKDTANIETIPTVSPVVAAAA